MMGPCDVYYLISSREAGVRGRFITIYVSDHYLELGTRQPGTHAGFCIGNRIKSRYWVCPK